jgi:hypothetical protein
MARTLTRTFVVVVMAVTAVAVTSVGVGAQPLIAPNQHFSGLVDGTRTSAVVYTVCAGPAWAGRTGPVAGGQTLAVAKARRGQGYTGPFTQIYAWFVPQGDGTTTPPTRLKFDSYRARQGIPTSIQVPCDGTGMVEFSSCPYLAPCAYGWIPDFVIVQFVNIAA